MKTATYRDLEGKPFTVEYDPLAPCVACGLPVWEASMGGTALCPWCDMGIGRDGKPQALHARPATPEERADGKGPTVFGPLRATDEEYQEAREAFERLPS